MLNKQTMLSRQAMLNKYNWAQWACTLMEWAMITIRKVKGIAVRQDYMGNRILNSIYKKKPVKGDRPFRIFHRYFRNHLYRKFSE